MRHKLSHRRYAGYTLRYDIYILKYYTCEIDVLIIYTLYIHIYIYMCVCVLQCMGSVCVRNRSAEDEDDHPTAW